MPSEHRDARVPQLRRHRGMAPNFTIFNFHSNKSPPVRIASATWIRPLAYFLRSAVPTIVARAIACVKRLKPSNAGVAVFGMPSVSTFTAYTVMK
jgi:hypothetical protein